MHILKTFSPLLKEPKLIDDLPVVLRVRKFDEASAKEFHLMCRKHRTQGNQCCNYY